MSNHIKSYVKDTITLARDSKKAHELLGKKTLGQVGQEFDLSDEDIDLIYSKDKKGNEIPNLSLKVEGEEFSIPFAREYPFDKMEDAKWFLNCEFRVGHLSKKDEDGTPLVDEATGKVILDMNAPYISFGKPSGITVERRTNAFTNNAVDATKAAAGLPV